jgi:hypothetical protein
MHPPSEDLFRDARTKHGIAVVKKSGKMAMLEQQVNDLSRNYGKILDDYETIITILREMQTNE